MARTIIFSVLAAAILYPSTAVCDEHVMAVGFQFSATSPTGPTALTDVAGRGLHFRTFYNVVNFSRRWHLVAEFGYNNFALRQGEYADLIGPALEDSVNAMFPVGPVYPPGSVAKLLELAIDGGDFNAMHVTAGMQYFPLPSENGRIRPYVTAQGGLYSTGQSDSDISASFSVTRPAMADTTLSWMGMPWTRDSDRDNAFGLNLGGGTEVYLTEEVALLADIRYHIAFTEDKSTSFYDIGIGIAYYLGF